MRIAVAVGLLAGCATQKPPPEPPSEMDAVWAQSIHAGDMIVAVPGTGAYDDMGTLIDANATLSQHANPSLNPIVLEQAIAAATRAGVSPSDVTIALWGSGASKRPSFTYTSLGGTTIEVVVLGGENSCASGNIATNILKYTEPNADADAHDLAAKITAAAPTGQVTIVAHSYGGAVAEHLAIHQLQPPEVNFVVAAGVPKLLVGEGMLGPGLRPEGDVQVYEVDRPDDPVHNMQFTWNLEGHQYDIFIGSQFQGSYGISTTEISCHGTPGPCPIP